MSPKIVSLGDVCNLVGGGTPTKSNSKFYGGEISWATVRDLSEDTILSTEHSITRDALNSSASNIIPKGNVILASRVGLGKICVAGIDVAINQDLRGVIPKRADQISPRYLYWWFKSVSPQIIAAGTGATVQGVTLPFLNSLAFPLVPIGEQCRIAAILDEAFEAIATATANAEKNLANASKLIELSWRSAMSAADWVETTLGEQVGLQRGFDITKGQQKSGIVPVVSSSGIKSFHDTAQVQGPGVVIGRKGSLGTVFYLEEAYWPHDTTLWVKQFNGNDPKFVYHFFKNLKVAHLDSGAANPALNRNVLYPIMISWPPRARQKAIAEQLDEFVAYIESLKNIYGQKVIALSDLRQSLLRAAFGGELTSFPNEQLDAAAE